METGIRAPSQGDDLISSMETDAETGPEQCLGQAEAIVVSIPLAQWGGGGAEARLCHRARACACARRRMIGTIGIDGNSQRGVGRRDEARDMVSMRLEARPGSKDQADEQAAALVHRRPRRQMLRLAGIYGSGRTRGQPTPRRGARIVKLGGGLQRGARR